MGVFQVAAFENAILFSTRPRFEPQIRLFFFCGASFEFANKIKQDIKMEVFGSLNTKIISNV